MLEATFVRNRGGRDRIYVTRADGTTTGWDFPSYGDGLPHDLCHLVVEDGLGMADGFWGLVDQGVDVGLVDNQATLLRGGRPLTAEAGADLSGLLAAEAAVARLGAPGGPSPESSEGGDAGGAEGRIRARLGELGDRWSKLEDGGSIRLVYGPAPGPAGAAATPPGAGRDDRRARPRGRRERR